MSTNEMRQEFIKKYKVEGRKLWEYPPNIDKFFTHEFENMQDAINGIIFYTNHDIHQKETLSNTRKMKTEMKIKKLKDETLNNCIHFFRFSELLNNSNIDEDYKNIKNGVRIYKKMDINEIQKIVQNRIDELIGEEKIKVWSAGLYFTRQEEAYYKRSYAYQTNLQEYNSAWWTEDLFSSIKYLRNLEQRDENTYYDTWIHCKIERERNRERNIQKNNTNIQMLQKAHSEYKQSMAKNTIKIDDKEIQREG